MSMTAKGYKDFDNVDKNDDNDVGKCEERKKPTLTLFCTLKILDSLHRTQKDSGSKHKVSITIIHVLHPLSVRLLSHVENQLRLKKQKLGDLYSAYPALPGGTRR
jgi:hypothetical protein